MRLGIEPFTGDGGDDKKEADAGGTGAATSLAVREGYGRLRDQQGGLRLGQVTSSGETVLTPPKEVVEAYPPSGLVAALFGFVDRLLPSRNREVSGAVRPRDPARGAGLTVTLARRYGKVFDEVTIWEREYGALAPVGEEDPVQPAYDHVALPAAVWLLFSAARVSVLGRLQHWPLGRRFEILGTASWRSYAQFAVGADLHATGDRRAARPRYLAALREDPENRGAMFNLGSLELSEAETNRDLHVRAQARLARVDERLRATGHPESEPLWYRARYNQTVAWLHPQFGDASTARRAAVEVSSALLKKRDGLERWPCSLLRPRSRELLRLLRNIEPMVLVILASALWRDGRPPATSSVAGSPVSRNVLAKALAAFATEPDSAEAGERFDAAVTHPAVAEYVRQKLSPLDVGATYNLACYYARVKNWAGAERQLNAAVELGGPALGRRALDDAVLESYFEDEERKKRLEKLIAELEELSPPPKNTVEAEEAKSVLDRIAEALAG